MDEHVCKPVVVDSLGRTMYQCGCGRYFEDEAAADQLIEYYKAVQKEFEDDGD